MRKVVFVAVVCAFMATPAMADVTGTAYLQNHNNSVSSTGSIRGDGIDWGTYYTGVYSWRVNTTTNPPTGEGSLVPSWGFCMDLPSSPVTGWHDVRPVEEAPIHSPAYGTPIGANKADLLRELAGRYWNPAWGTGAARAEAEAFSFAVWEIVYEPYQANASLYNTDTWSPNGSTANGTYFEANDNTATARANQMLWSLTGDSNWFDYNIRALTSLDGQDFLVRVPIPGAVLLGVVGFAAARRKLRQFI